MSYREKYLKYANSRGISLEQVFYEKYLLYKSKYLKLKGGADNVTNPTELLQVPAIHTMGQDCDSLFNLIVAYGEKYIDEFVGWNPNLMEINLDTPIKQKINNLITSKCKQFVTNEQKLFLCNEIYYNCLLKKLYKKTKGVTYNNELINESLLRSMVLELEISENDKNFVKEVCEFISNLGFDFSKISRRAYANTFIPEVKIPICIKIIEDEAYYYGGIKKLTFNNNVTSIGNRAFGRNNIDGELIIPDSVETIGENAFEGNKIKKLTLNNNVKHISIGAFSYNKINGELIIPDSVETIGESSFHSNRITGNLIIPNSVKLIGPNAFSKNRIEHLVISNSVESIGSNAFDENRLQTVTIPRIFTSRIPDIFGREKYQTIQFTYT